MARRKWAWQEGYIGKPWPRMMSPDTFNFHFYNMLPAMGRKATYLCFEVEGQDQDSVHKGVFQNQVSQGAPGHAELCFLDWFCDTLLSPNASYHVTWYISWSPCFECAKAVERFLNENRNVSLSITAARLYLCDQDDEQGLRDLRAAGAELDVMSPEDFKYCWDQFVYNEGKPFKYWKNVRRWYYDMKRMLQEVLCGLPRGLRRIYELDLQKKHCLQVICHPLLAAPALIRKSAP